MMLKLSYIKLFQILRGTRANHFAQILEVFTAERMLLCDGLQNEKRWCFHGGISIRKPAWPLFSKSVSYWLELSH